ncbi:hypothetical protein Tco_1417254 [Tanacetum coccineum]
MYNSFMYLDPCVIDVSFSIDQERSQHATGKHLLLPAPKTAKQLAARRNHERVKSILLLAIPDEYLLKFHNVTDAKSHHGSINTRMATLTGQVRKIPCPKTGRKMEFKEKQLVPTFDNQKLSDTAITEKGNLLVKQIWKESKKRSYVDNWQDNAPINEIFITATEAQDGPRGYDCSNDFEIKPVNYALMAISSSSSSSSSDNESTDHLIKDCDFYDKRSPEPKLKNVVNTGPRVVKPVWDNAKRVNHQNFSKYPHFRKTFVPSGVLTRTGLITPVKQNEKRAVHKVSTARPVSTVRPFALKIAQTSGAIRPIYPRMDNVRPRGSYSPIKRTRAVVNTGKGKMDTDLKKSRWVWRPKGNYLDHVSKDSGSFMLKKVEYVDPKGISKSDHAVVDSGCSSHMTGNKAYLSDYEDYNGGFVAFGSDPKGGKITGKGKIRTANLDFDDVYFVDELKFNLFSVSQRVTREIVSLFITETECLILSPSFKLLDESQVVLRAPRKDDVYSLDLKNIIPSGDSLGKFDGKSGEGYLLGYSTSSKAFRNTQDSYVACSSRKDKGPTQEYILLPLQPHRTRIPVEDVAPATHEKPSEISPKDNDDKTQKMIRNDKIR